MAAQDAVGGVEIDLDALQAEHDENEIRKSFTVTERLAIAQRIAERLCPDGSRQGQRTDLGKNLPMSEKGKTAEIAARQSGLGSRETLKAAQKVVEHGAPELVEAMDRGKVTSAKSLLSLVGGAWAKTVNARDASERAWGKLPTLGLSLNARAAILEGGKSVGIFADRR